MSVNPFRQELLLHWYRKVIPDPYEEGKLEAHRRYMDVQIFLKGGEVVYYTDIDGLEITVPYKEDADIVFYGQGGQPAKVTEGMFYAVMPS